VTLAPNPRLNGDEVSELKVTVQLSAVRIAGKAPSHELVKSAYVKSDFLKKIE
jgi:hypothetical protein